MSEALDALVGPTAARGATYADVCRACAQLGEASAEAREAATATLLAFAQSDSLVDDAAYIRIAGICEDADVLLILAQHTTFLLAACVDDPSLAPLGLELAMAIADELDAGATSNAEIIPLGLSMDAHLWCHAIAQLHIIPQLLPAVLRVVYQAHVSNALHTLALAANASRALLGWHFAAVPALPEHATPAEVMEAVRHPSPHQATMPAAIADIYFAQELSVVLVAAAHSATKAADVPQDAWAAHAAVRHVHEAIQQLLLQEPPAQGEGAWLARQSALATALHAYVDHVTQRPARTLVVEDLETLRLLAQVYQSITSGDSGRALLREQPQALLLALARMTEASFYASFVLVPAADDESLAASADAAVNEVLALWRTLLGTFGAEDAVQDAVKEHLRDHVVLAYLQGRLHAATRSAQMDDVDEAETGDAELYAEQLSLYAALARSCLAEVVAAIYTSLDPVQAQLHGPSVPDATWEQLHWLALIAAAVLADPPENEQLQLPASVLQSPPAAQDTIVRIIHTLSLVLLPALLPHGPTDALPASPLALASLLAFCARWVPVYLFPSDATSSLVLATVFASTESEKILDTLLDCVQLAFSVWRFDQDVLLAAAALVESFARTPGAMRVLLARDAMQTLVKHTLSTLEQLPDATHAPILRACIRCVDCTRDGIVAAHDARAAYYPHILDAVHARIHAAMHAPRAASLSPAVHSALGLVRALAQSADPYVSRTVHEHLVATLPSVVALAQTHTEVMLASMQAMHAVLEAQAEMDAPELHAQVAQCVYALVQVVRPELGDEELAAALFQLLHALAEMVDTTQPVDHGAEYAEPATVCVDVLGQAAPQLTLELLAVPLVREAVVDAVTTLLLKTSAALVKASGTCLSTLSVLALLDAHNLRAAPLGERGSSALHVALCAVVFFFSTADTLIETKLAAVPPAFSMLAAHIPYLEDVVPPAEAQTMLDTMACSLLHILLLRPLHAPSLVPILLVLRTLTLARVQAAWLGGEASFMQSIAHYCANAVPRADTQRSQLFAHAAQHLFQCILASHIAPQSNAPPALAARLMVNEEQRAAIRLCRDLRPFLLQTHGVLCMR
ncbi:hypothetical protein MVES1_002445 [Malassezia vespertilionis]|uniref:uncharacterized protein n=1 Tax=Malassezia vespertilionis TaxID=2020962 RepID=UPI0024B09606|nr:uncharacterized protein MVES1_002445 [Malassezia vespertilionis]WFD07089.1 hypothetical protein MVES1_002445 [Malassezia vespertilionis]